MTFTFAPDHLALIRRMRNIGLNQEDIRVELHRAGVHCSVEDIRAAIKAGLPSLVDLPRTRTYSRSIHSTSGISVVPSASQMAERQDRLGARHRDLTAELMGDPPIGFSALERRGGG